MTNLLYLTTAIDYVNSIPHIGTAYEKIGADVLTRFYRLCGADVRFQMGNDEHSANVQKAAQAQGLEPKKYCDSMRPKFEGIWQSLHISYDDFIQTSEPRHHEAVLKFFEKVQAKGDITERDYEGWYCESCEAFYTEKDLENDLCPNHKSQPKWLKERNYFFKMKGKEKTLLDHIEKNPTFILPAKRRNEVVQFIKQGLQDTSISRSTFSWGIPLPLNPKHVFYVWFDALINYVTAVGFAQDAATFQKWWPHATHIVGKDITRFHCVIWPLMLMSAGVPLPQHVFGHGFVYLKGEKMSKSLGNVVTPLDILEKYPEFGADALRYTLMRTSSFGDDGDFTWDGFVERYNADLANGIGNLASRILGMVWKYQGGSVFPGARLAGADLACQPLAGVGPDDALLKKSVSIFEHVKKDLDPVASGDINTHFALEKIWTYITEVDQYIDKKAPWTLAKNQATEELSQVLTCLTECIARVCILVSPFMPRAAQKIWSAYGFDVLAKLADTRSEGLSKKWIEGKLLLKEEKLNVFPRIESIKNDSANSVGAPFRAPEEKGKISHQTDVINHAPTNDGPFIEITDFAKIDLRVAKVLKAERVEKADKLLRLDVEIGSETRQIIAGIAQHYAPETLVGKSIVVVANLKPAKIRGLESRGMLLAAKNDKELFILSPESPIVSGAKVG